MDRFKMVFIVVLMLFAFQYGHAQWSDKTNFNQVIKDLKEFNGNLFIAGNFTRRVGSNCYWSAFYDGSTFTNQTNLIGGFGLNNLEVFNNTLYAVGGLDGTFGTGLSTWTGTTWSSGGFNTSHSAIFADGNDLYVGSDFGVLSKRTGSGPFSAFPTLEGFNKNISAITKFNGDIIVGGGFSTYDSVTLNKLARWDGTTWQPLGSGLSGGFSGGDVRSLIVYKGELYVGGAFTGAGGQTITNLAWWNGTTWSDVGGSVTDAGGNGVRDMIIYNNELYVSGDFSEIGGVSAKYVAKWNGTAWTGLSITQSNDFVECIEVFQGKLYAGTADFNESHLYSYALPTGIEKEVSKLEVSLFPNPATEILTIQRTDDHLNSRCTIAIINTEGKIIAEDLSNSRIVSFNTSDWAKGIYHAVIRDKDNKPIVTNRFLIM